MDLRLFSDQCDQIFVFRIRHHISGNLIWMPCIPIDNRHTVFLFIRKYVCRATIGKGPAALPVLERQCSARHIRFFFACYLGRYSFDLPGRPFQRLRCLCVCRSLCIVCLIGGRTAATAASDQQRQRQHHHHCNCHNCFFIPRPPILIHCENHRIPFSKKSMEQIIVPHTVFGNKKTRDDDLFSLAFRMIISLSMSWSCFQIQRGWCFLSHQLFLPQWSVCRFHRYTLLNPWIPNRK